jgi:hypothetical protein
VVVSAIGGARGGPRKRVSEVLIELAGDGSGRLRLGDVVTALGDRGYGLLIFILALPNVLPIYIPGLSAVFGVPLALIALQMMLGQPRPWLPRALLHRPLRRQDFANLTQRILPWLLRLERILKPRLPVLTSPWAERLIGVFALVLAVMLALPIPFTGIPLGAALALMGIGLLERDGLVLMTGAAAGMVAVAYSGLATFAAWEAVLAFWNWLLG